MLGLAISPGIGAAVVDEHRSEFLPTEVMTAELERIERERAPRWVWWSKSTASALIASGLRPARCWDLSAVHRLMVGGWAGGPERIWATLHDLDHATIPTDAPIDLFTQVETLGDENEPIRPDGHLRPDWIAGSWASTPARVTRWAELALDQQRLQSATLATAADAGRRRTTALSESAAEIICAELEADGLPFDRSIGESIIGGFIGPRPKDAADERTQLAELDRRVLEHLPTGVDFDLRSPDQVKSLLRRVGIEVPDTRAWRLEQLRDAHSIVEPLLVWRRAERIRTTFGYPWIDDHVGVDGRLRGHWSGSDGAAGRMTATAGLHNMPSEMRPAIAAEAGHVFVRADLGQIEPRVLAAISGDARLASATHDDDMYAPVAAQLEVDREIAKVAVLGAMYGQTTGKGAEALRRLEREYPVAMGYLRSADEAAQGGNDLRTYGGRRIRMSGSIGDEMTDRDVRSRAAARGRYGRNAMVQGAAAEFFKTWAVLMRVRGAGIGARIVLCLHDELVVHTPVERGAETAELLDSCLQEAAYRWAPAADVAVRFVADTSVIARWSDAK